MSQMSDSENLLQLQALQLQALQLQLEASAGQTAACGPNATAQSSGTTQSASASEEVTPSSHDQKEDKPAGTESPAAVDHDWQRQLSKTAESEDFDKVTELLQNLSAEQIEIERQNGCGRIVEAVCTAARHLKGENALRAFVEMFGAQCLLLIGPFDMTPLHWACKHQSSETALHLVEVALNISDTCLEIIGLSTSIDSCIHLAAANEISGDLIIQLINRYYSAKSILWRNKIQLTPLHIACQIQSLDTVLNLIKIAIQIDSDCLQMRDIDGETCIHCAACNTNHEETIMELLRMTPGTPGENLLRTGNQGLTPLHRACGSLSAATVLKLLEMAIQFDSNCLEIRDNDGETCIHHAALNNKHAETIIELVKRTPGCSGLLWTNSSGRTALHCACSGQSAATVLDLVAMAIQIDSDCLEKRDSDCNTYIHLAALNSDHGDVITELLKNTPGNKGLFWRNSKGRTPLHNYCKTQGAANAANLAEMAIQVDCDCLENLRDNEGNTCLHDAVFNFRDEETIIELLKRTPGGKGLFWADNKGQTPLHIACMIQGTAVLSKLFEVAIKIDKDFLENMRDNEGNSCIHSAAISHDIDSTKTIIELVKLTPGGRGLFWTNNNGKTPLHTACLMQTAAKVSELVAMAIQIDSNCLESMRDNGCFTCIHFAAFYDDASVILELIKMTPERKCLFWGDSNGATPLHYACRVQSAAAASEIVAVAMQIDGDCLENVRDNYGNTCIHHAAHNTSHEETIIQLSKMTSGGRGLFWTNNSGETPLHIACLEQSATTVSVLVQIASQIDSNCLETRDNDGDTCIHHAANNNDHNETILELASMTSGVKGLLWTNKRGRTPLHFACISQSAATVSALLEMALRIDNNCLDLRDTDCNTCVHFAASNSRDEETVLEVARRTPGGKGLFCTNSCGSTPLHVAFYNCSAATVLKLAEMASQIDSKFLKSLRDNDGNSCLDAAAGREQDSKELLEMLAKYAEDDPLMEKK